MGALETAIQQEVSKQLQPLHEKLDLLISKAIGNVVKEENEEWLNRFEAARLLGISIESLKPYRKKGLIRFNSKGQGSNIMYLKSSIIERLNIKNS